MMVDTAKAIDALHSIPPSLPRKEWVKVGMAAQAAGLDFDTFNNWSAGADNYDARATRDTWRSIKPGKGIGAGSLFYMAAQYGQAPAPAKRPPAPERKPAPGMTAAEVWNRAQPASANHPYALRKGLTGQPLEQLRQLPEGDSLRIGGRSMAGALAVPAYGRDGQLQSLQLIPPQGQKMNLAGHAMAGASFTVGTPQTSQPLYLCEGVGAAWSCWQATGHAAICCFGWGNVSTVAQSLLASDRAAKLVLIPDVGKEASAADIARKLGCTMATMPQGEAQNFDANDLAQRDGLPALAQVLQAAQAPSVEALLSRDIDADTGELREGSAWPEPTPLPDDLPPVDAFDSELLPQALRGWVMDIAERMQCPPDFPAVAVITAVSSVIGARAVVLPKVKDDWQVVPNLWGMIVGRPGVMKSPALTQAIGALNRLEGAARESWQEKNREWELDCKVAALAAKSIEKQAEKEAAKNPEKARQLLAQQMDFEADNPKPPKRRYVVNDTTMEALADILTDNPWGLLVYRDEMHGLLCSMDKQGQEGARGFFLTGYDGNQGYAVDRIMRGHSYVDRVCLAMLGGIQPARLQSYVRDAVTGGAGDDGLLQRFGLTVWPDVNQAFAVVDRWPNSEAKNAAGAVFDRLNSLEPDWDDTPQQWRFSPNAQALFYEWLVPFETSIRGDGMHPALVSHLAKWRKLVPALALIFAQVDTPESPGNQIHELELTRALAWAQYLLSHAKRVYSAATTPETFGAKHLLEKIKGGKLVDADGVLLKTFAPRQVALKGWAGLAMVADVRKAAETLTDYGWLARIEPAVGAKGGRPSDLFRLHPCLLQRGAQ